MNSQVGSPYKLSFPFFPANSTMDRCTCCPSPRTRADFFTGICITSRGSGAGPPTPTARSYRRSSPSSQARRRFISRQSFGVLLHHSLWLIAINMGGSWSMATFFCLPISHTHIHYSPSKARTHIVVVLVCQMAKQTFVCKCDKEIRGKLILLLSETEKSFLFWKKGCWCAKKENFQEVESEEKPQISTFKGM